MSRIIWDADNERYLEYGINRGVLYVKLDAHNDEIGTFYNPGVVWNGLTSVDIEPDGFDKTAVESDGFIYDNLYSPEYLVGNIESYGYPDVFAQCIGKTNYTNGVYVGQQKHRKFGFCYRTEVTGGYIIHVIYNCTAYPAEESSDTFGENADVKLYSWKFDTMPVESNERLYLAPFSEITFDSRKIPLDRLLILENTLYGTDGSWPILPDADILLNLVDTGVPPTPWPTGAIAVEGVFTSNGYYEAPAPYAWTPVTVNVPTGDADALIEGTITSYTGNASMIKECKFYHCFRLTTVSFPVCTSIGASAFEDCYMLTSVSFPVCSYIGSDAFYNCIRLTSVSFPVCSYISCYAFHGCDDLTSVEFPACSYIGSDAFYNCSSLSSVSFPVCSYIDGVAFGYCHSLISVAFPVCSYIGNMAFTNCTSLTSISFPVCSYIGVSAFFNCRSLTSISFPVCSYINDSAFYHCRSLTSVLFPACSYIGSSAFYGCSSLSSVSFPVCSYISRSAFAGCTSLTFVSFPACTYIGINAFLYCTSLTSVSFPACSYIGGGAFHSCSSLSTAIFLSTSVARLSHSNAFQSTPMQYSSYLGYFGSIYVPASLVDAYKSATNWVYYSDRITSYVE